MGDKVNMAARLMCKAKGGVYLDEETYNALPAEDQQLCELQEPITVKGKDTPLRPALLKDTEEDSSLPSFGVLLARQAEQDSSKLHSVGRRSEKKIIWRSLCMLHGLQTTRLRSVLMGPQHCRVLCIEGVSGMGKTTLVQYLRVNATLKGFHTYTVSNPMSAKQSASFALYTLRNLVIQLLGIKRAGAGVHKDAYLVNKKPPPSLRQQLLKFMDASFARSVGAPVLDALLCVPEVEQEVIVPQRDVMEKLLPKFIEKLLQLRPTVIVFEDMHRSDSDSWWGVQELARTLMGPVLLCITVQPPETSLVLASKRQKARRRRSVLPRGREASIIPVAALKQFESTEQWETFYRTIQQQPCTVAMFLDPLELDDVSDLIAVVFQGFKVIPRPAIKVLGSIAGGNPFWVMEAAQHIRKECSSELDVLAAVLEHGDLQEVAQELDAFEKKLSSLMRTMFGTDVMSKRKTKKGTSDAGTNESKLSSLVVSRYERLSPEEQTLLRWGSVFGPMIPATLLYDVLPSSIHDVAGELIIQLARKHFLQPCGHAFTSMDPQNQQLSLVYCFTNPIIRSTIYELTPTSKRQQLHRFVADRVVLRFGENLTLFHSILFFHYNLATNGNEKDIERIFELLETRDRSEESNEAYEVFSYSLSPRARSRRHGALWVVLLICERNYVQASEVLNIVAER
jgi:predicted ATPase